MGELTTRIAALIGRVVTVEADELTESTRFDAIEGWSSVAALALMVELEEQWPLALDLRAFMAVQTVGELVELVARDLEREADSGAS